MDQDLKILVPAPGYNIPPQLQVYLAFYWREAFKERVFEEFADTVDGSLTRRR